MRLGPIISPSALTPTALLVAAWCPAGRGHAYSAPDLHPLSDLHEGATSGNKDAHRGHHAGGRFWRVH